MPDPKDPLSADAENNTPEAPPSRPGPLQDRERMDVGCLFLMVVSFVGIFALPAIFLLGGAPAILPLLTLLLVALVTPFINPTDRMSDKARWIGRVVTFLVLSLLVVIAWYMIFMRDLPILRE
jgi:hypothetical protein